MSSSSNNNSKGQCFLCQTSKYVYKCVGCSNEFCIDDLTKHRQTLSKDLAEIENDRDQLQNTIKEDKPDSCLIEEINEWEQNSIALIRNKAKDYRNLVVQYTKSCVVKVENQLVLLTQQLKDIRQENDFNELDLNGLQEELRKISEEITDLPGLSLEKSSRMLINDITILVSSSSYDIDSCSPVLNKQWKEDGITVAGGNGYGANLDQLLSPEGIFVDRDNNILVADLANDRIIEWKCDSSEGRIMAGGNGRGNGDFQLSCPTDLIVDEQNDCLIVADRGNRRVIRWMISQNGTKPQILISNIVCYGLAMDKNGFLYVSDVENHEVRRWKEEDKQAQIVAGGNGQGDCLNQLDHPTFIFVDENQSLYVSDRCNERVMKWVKNAQEGIVVAGGNGRGDRLNQLDRPTGVIVHHCYQIYVADCLNHRVMRWCEGNEEGEIVVGGNGQESESNQLSYPYGLSFDSEGNLYVSDSGNEQIQKYELDVDFDSEDSDE